MNQIVEISSRGTHLSSKGDLLCVRSADGDEKRLPYGELGALILASEDITITGSVLARLAEHGVSLISCQRFRPVATLAAIASHERLRDRQEAQILASRPLKKNLWRKLVRAKIENQANVLQAAGECSSAQRLRELSARVLSGDRDNKEAQAARIYWKRLLGLSFSRRATSYDPMNAALNYGYTIERSLVARHILAAGLLPSISLAHVGASDGLMLADDLMEPLRPLVDYGAARLWQVNENREFGPTEKQSLVSWIFATRVRMDGNLCDIAEAARLQVASLVSSFETRNVALVTPEIECQ